MSDPFISVLIVNRNARDALQTCLASLQEQDYPRDRFEAVLVDNGSTDDSTRFTHEQFPSVRIIRNGRNRGFGGALHAAVAHTRGDYLAVLDKQARVETTWLRELVTATVRKSAAAASSKILNWEGTGIDFAGGILSLFGHSWSLGQGAPAESRGTDSDRLPFGSAHALLVERGAYHAAGGFDPDYFAYGEEVDLGWRMSLMGLKTVFAPAAVAYRREEPSDRPAGAPRIRLEERNALFTIYKCLGDDLLHRVLPVAIALTLARATHRSHLSPMDFGPDALAPSKTTVSRQAVATLIALQDFTLQLERLSEKRETVQSRRTVADETLLPLFVEPLRTHPLGPEYESIAWELYQEFGLSQLVSRPKPRRAKEPSDSPSRPEPTPNLGAGSWAQSGDAHPSVSIVVLTALGPTYLPECLASLRDLRYPQERVELILVDNASPEDPTPSVRKHYPKAKVVRLPENRGFCGGIAAGVREARGKWLAFLNDDARVDPAWMEEMLATADRRRTRCVAARILDWSGERIDFAGGAVNFEAKGFQLGHGSTELNAWDEERPALFPCGAAMLVRRDLFLEAGGFDEALFAYYEDLAFGWELWIRGHDVWISPRAVVYHRHHGTAGRWSSAWRTRLYERNSLRIVMTHLEQQNLGRALSASLLLLTQRILSTTPFVDWTQSIPPFHQRLRPRNLWRNVRAIFALRGAERRHGIRENSTRLRVKDLLAALWSTARFAAGSGRRSQPLSALSALSAFRMEDGLQDPSFDGQPVTVTASTGARLAALDEWLISLPRQRKRRQELQRHRKRSDAQVLSAFASRWTAPVGAEPPWLYSRVHEAVVKAFSLDRLVRPMREPDP